MTVYHDSACPKCRRTRKAYEKLPVRQQVWFDITGQDQRLRDLGIDPQKALSELHVRETNGRILPERDAYILLMNKVPLLKPVAWLIVLPLIRPLLVQLYHWQVNRRLESREASFDANLKWTLESGQ